MLGQLLLARWLAPDAFGALAFANVVTSVAAALAQLGLGSALVQAERLTREEARAAAGLAWLQGALLAFLAAALAPICAAVLGAPELIRLLPVYALTLVLAAPTGVALALLQRRLAFGRITRLQLGAGGLGLAASLTLAAAGLGVWALVLGRLAGDGLLLLGALLAAGRESRPSWRLGRARRFLRFGANVTGTQLLNTVASQLDNALLGATLGSVALGRYGVAWSLAMLPATRLAGSVKGVAFAALARRSESREGFEAAARALLLHTAVACAPPVVGLAAVADPAVPWLLGAQWTECAALLRALAPASIVFALGSAMGAILLARGASHVELRFALLRVALLGPLLWLGIRLAGAQGAALAVSVYALAALPPFFFVLARWAGLRPLFVLRALAPGLVAAAACGAAASAASELASDGSPPARLAAAVVSGALATFLCLRLGFAGDLRTILATVRSAWPAAARNVPSDGLQTTP
jgi:O-antigen/teichoic acid export membrane protein